MITRPPHVLKSWNLCKSNAEEVFRGKRMADFWIFTGRYVPLAWFGDSARVSRPPDVPTEVIGDRLCRRVWIAVGWNPEVDSEGRGERLTGWSIGYKDLLRSMDDITNTPCLNPGNRTIGGWMIIPGREELRISVSRDGRNWCRSVYGRLPPK